MENTSSGGKNIRQTGFQVLVFWFCVLLTFIVIAGGVRLFLSFMKNRENISGAVVLLTGVNPPGEKASVDELRGWIKGFSPALPKCRCSLGKTAPAPEPQSLLFCVGFSTGSKACSFKAEKIPAGIKMKVSRMPDIDSYAKVIFMLAESTPFDIIAPRTCRNLESPR